MSGELERKREQDLALIRSLHGTGTGDEPRPTATPHFDGGVRGELTHRSPPWFQRRFAELPPGWEPDPED